VVSRYQLDGALLRKNPFDADMMGEISELYS
jgi:hypothetical protein